MNARWVKDQAISHVRTILRDAVSNSVLIPNKALKNRHTGQRCFILGSGMSVKELDLKLLHGEIVMTQNHFHAHEDIAVIDPLYHVVVPKYQSSEFDDNWVEWLHSMDERLPKKTVMFFGENTKYLLEKLNLFRDRVFYMRQGYSAIFSRRAPVDITRGIMVVPTVITQCLAVALYLGFSEIVLLGFDLDQVCRIAQRDKVRFYGLSPVTANQAEISAEEQLGRTGEDWFNMWLIWKECNLLLDEAVRRGTRIVNATPGGMLNVFDRVPFDTVIHAARQPH
jgi:uncharacterized Rossmann fold enzyme